MGNPARQPRYRAVIEKANGDRVEFEGFTKLQYEHKLNRGSVASITCPINYSKIEPATTSVRKSWLRIYRKDSDSSDERLIWYGLCYRNSYSGDEQSAGTITTHFESLANLLAHRRIDSNYSGFSITALTDQSQILWDLINDSQGLSGGDLGITQGNLPASKDRIATTELQYRTIKDVMESYSEVIEGIDWEITPTLTAPSEGVFNTFFRGATERYHKGNVLSTPLVYHIDGSSRRLNNIASYTIEENGKKYANQIRVIGQTVENSPITSVDSNSSAISTYGLFDDVVNESNLKDQGTVDDRATEALNARDTVPVEISVKLTPHTAPRVGSYDVGDIFEVDFKHYQAREFKAQYRVYGVTVTVDEKGIEHADIDLGII